MKFHLLILFVLLLSSANVSWATDFSSASYDQSITDAINNAYTPSSYYNTSILRSINDSTNVTRTASGVEQVLVGTFTRSDRNISNRVGSKNDVFGNATTDAMWVSLAPDLYNHLKNNGYSAAQAHNEISRAVGMNTTNINDMVIEMWAVKNVDNLQRPTLAVDPVAIPAASQLGYPNPTGTNFIMPADWLTKTVNIKDKFGVITTITMADAYKQWYAGQTNSALTKRTFPWTQLGYTYLWGNGNDFPGIVGLTEFVLRHRPNPTAVPVNYDYEISGIYSQQSYVYRVLPTGKTYQDLPSNGDFHVTGTLDTLWTGRRFQPTGNSVIIDSASQVSSGQGLLLSSVGYTVNNAGEISGSTKDKYYIGNTSNIGVLFLGEDPDSTGKPNTLINTGTIQSPGTAIKATDATGVNASTIITNTGGTINGINYAILTNEGDDTVTSTSNSTIKGNVNLGNGTNTLALNASSMSGNVTTGTGNDNIFIQNKSVYNGTLATGSGDDIVDIDKSYFKGDVNMGGNPNDIFKVNAGSTLDFATGEIKPVNLEKLQLLPDPGGVSKNINLGIDVNLARSTGDLISATQVSGTEKFYINKINQFGNIPTKSSIVIPVISPANGLSSKTQLGVTSVMTPIYKYAVGYDQSTGNLAFVGGGSSSGGYNPAILSSSVASLAGSYLTQINTYSNAFANMDMTMLMPQAQRQALKFKNKYAAADANLVFTPTMIPEEDKGLWYRPYTSFENVPLRNGPDVSNVMYGSLFGGDTPLIELKNGFAAVFSGYGAYNGSHQAYQGVGIYQNGGLLGSSAVFYKGDFFTGLTANVGANAAEASTMYGQDNFTMLTTGVASKTGYNCELFDGKFIVQPSYLMSYTYVNTFDSRTASSVDIKSDPLNAIQISPALKLIWNLKNSWQPYLGVSMIWNIMDDTKFKASDVSLPELSVKPYVLYGLGVQKRWGERFTGFFQTFVSNGGRNGVDFLLGLRWKV